MKQSSEITRRTFLKGTAQICASSRLIEPDYLFASEVKKSAFMVGGFTKTLQHLGLDYEQTAEAAAEIGWDGIECPVREKGHVLPERVEEDLPKMAEALERRNLKILVMATDIHNPKEQYTEVVLRTGTRSGSYVPGPGARWI